MSAMLSDCAGQVCSIVDRGRVYKPPTGSTTWGAASSLRPGARRSMRDGVGLSGGVTRLRRQPMADLRTVGVQLVSRGRTTCRSGCSTLRLAIVGMGYTSIASIRTRGPGRASPGAVGNRRPAPSISITAPPTQVERWRPGVSVNCSTGWIDTAPRVPCDRELSAAVPPSSFVVVYAQLF